MPTGRRAMARCRRPGLHAAAVPGGGCRTGRRRSGTARERYSRLTVENGVPRMSLSFAAVEVPRVRLARDIKVDGREAPNPSRDGVPSGPGAHACHGVSQRSLTVGALMGSIPIYLCRTPDCLASTLPEFRRGILFN